MGNLKPNQNPSSEKNIYIFFSFDMVGSTKLKTKKENWPFCISSFYYTVYTKLQHKIPQIKEWKYLGDEILLYVSLRDLSIDFDSRSSLLIEIPKIVYDVQSEVAEIIQKDSRVPELNVKSTVWIAGVQTIEWEPSPLDKNYQNITATIDMEAKGGKENKTENGTKNRHDFLGPDMDIGFRIAKFAFHHKVVLSADFAYLLYKIPKKFKNGKIGYKIDAKLRIVSYEILKGVWEEQDYPIVWYYPYWNTAPYGLFYADHKKNNIAERVLSGKIDPINKLTQVYDDLGKTAEIDKFVDECISYLK